MPTCSCAYQGVKNNNFSESFAFVLSGWSLVVNGFKAFWLKKNAAGSNICLWYFKLQGKFTGHEFEVYYKKHFYTALPGDILWSKGNIHHYTLANILWCSCRDNDPLKDNFGDKILGF